MSLYYFRVVEDSDNNETELVVSSNREEIEETHRKRKNDEGVTENATVGDIEEVKKNKIHFNSESYIE